VNADVNPDDRKLPRRRFRTLSAAVTALALACAAVAVPAGAAYADAGTNLGQTNLSPENYVQDAAPPAGTQYARVIAQGGAGGFGIGKTGASTPPGLGMNITGYLPVSGTLPLGVAVGQAAELTTADNSIGGWGNDMPGGDGSLSPCDGNPNFASFSGGGGGATSIKRDGKLLLVAGGGGGGGGGIVDCGTVVYDAGKGGDAGPTPQDGARGIKNSDPNPVVFGGKAGAAPTGAGVSAGNVPDSNGPGGAGGGGVLGGDAGAGSPYTGLTGGGGGGGAGTSMTATMAGVTNAAGRDPSDGFVSITWYSDVTLAFTDAPSTVAAGVATALTVMLTDPDGNQADIGDGATFSTGDPSDTIVDGSITFGKTGPRTVTATFGTESTTMNLVVVPGAATGIQIGLRAYAYAGDTITPTATLVDSEGNDIGPASSPAFSSDSSDDTVNTDGSITLQPGVSRTATISAQSVNGNDVLRGEVKLLVTTDYAYKTMVTASSSLEAFGFGAQQLTDGDTQSEPNHHGFTTDPAVQTQDSDAWVAVDLGTTRSIGGVVLSPRTAVAPEPANGTDGAGFPQDFTIDVSNDGTTWTTAGTYTGQNGDSGPHTYRFAKSVTGRFVRVNATLLGPFAEGDDGFRLQLAGMQVYADPAIPAPRALQLVVSSEGDFVSVYGLDAYGAPTGQGLDCDVTVTSSNPSDEVLAPWGDCSYAFGLSTGSAGPRTLTATLNSDPSVTGSVTFTASLAEVQLGVHPDRMEYGKAGVVHVTSKAHSTPVGKVEVREGSKVLASGALNSGKVDIAIGGKTLRPGRHHLTVRYLGSHDHRPTSADVSVVVAKATTTLKATAPGTKVTAGSTRARVKVAATSRGGKPTGTVLAVVAGRVVGTGTLSHGKVTLTLKAFHHKGTFMVKLRYLGDATHAACGTTVRIVVRAAHHSAAH
jgi:hypothetical protein